MQVVVAKDSRAPVNDAEWNRLRNRAILEAFRTGRSVFADSDGELRYGDGKHEPVSEGEEDAAMGLPPVVLPKPPWWIRVRRWLGGGE